MNTIQTKIINYIDCRETKLILFFAIIGMLICGWVQYIQYGRINIDSVIYFESAKAISMGNWTKAIDIYNWPFYSACIAFLHVISGLSMENAAQLLNILFFGVTTISFLILISFAGGKHTEIIFGALLLFSSRHIVGNMLTVQMRDEGFWAFYLTSIVFFIRFIQSNKLTDALLWQLFIIIATLFRIEGLAQLILLPLIICFSPSIENGEKWKSYLQCNCLTLSIGLITWMLLPDNLLESLRLNEINPKYIANSFLNLFISRSDLLAKEVLGVYLGTYAIESLIFALIIIIIHKTINAIGFVNFSLSLYGFKNRKLFDQTTIKILIVTSVISFISLMFIITKEFVIVGRYTAPLALMLLIFSALSIKPLIDRRHKNKLLKQIFFIFLSLFTLINLAKNLRPETHQDFYMKEAAIWLKNKNIHNKSVLYDNILTRYYAGETYIGDLRNDMVFLKKALINKDYLYYQYLLINYEGGDEQEEKEKLIKLHLNQYKPIMRFDNYKKNKYVIIYESFK